MLVDRSETNLTEVAVNFWRQGLTGPPHSHDKKEQVFFVTDGSGVVNVGKESHQVRPGSLLYIPAGIIHQSVTTVSSLTYLLFNAFLEPTKEGCSSYREHIHQVKAIRQQQAAAAANKAWFDPSESEAISAKKPSATTDPGGFTSAVLLARGQTEACEVERIGLSQGEHQTTHYSDREQTLFVLSGSGTMVVDGQTVPIKPGAVIFIPTNFSLSLTAGIDGLAYLSLSTFAS